MSGSKIDVNFLNPFIDGALETLKVQCAFDVRPGQPFLRTQGQALDVEIAAVIALTSYAFKGSIAICFPTPVFLSVMGNMLGEKYDSITKELEDGASELLNIIFGQAKRTLNQKGYSIDKAIPAVVRGKSINEKNVIPPTSLVVPFETSQGKFFMGIFAQ